MALIWEMEGGDLLELRHPLSAPKEASAFPLVHVCARDPGCAAASFSGLWQPHVVGMKQPEEGRGSESAGQTFRGIFLGRTCPPVLVLPEPVSSPHLPSRRCLRGDVVSTV